MPVSFSSVYVKPLFTEANVPTSDSLTSSFMNSTYLFATPPSEIASTFTVTSVAAPHLFHTATPMSIVSPGCAMPSPLFADETS